MAHLKKKKDINNEVLIYLKLIICLIMLNHIRITSIPP